MNVLDEHDIRILVEGRLTHFPQWSHLDLLREIMCALIPVESSRNPWAARHEPGYRWSVEDGIKPRTCTQTTEEVLQKTSWGLCQIMGATARDMGFEGWLTELVDPKTNLNVGLRYLSRLGHRYGWNRDDMISAWNQGSPRKGPDGKYLNQAYVDKVLVWLTKQNQERNFHAK